MSDVRQRIVAMIYDVVKPERPELSDYDKRLSGGVLDSLDFATLLLAIEDEFNISFGETDMTDLGTINELAAFIEARRTG